MKMHMDYFDIFRESTQEKQSQNALSKSQKRSKKGKKLKNWQGNCNTVWQGRRRY